MPGTWGSGRATARCSGTWAPHRPARFLQFGDPDDATLAHHNEMLGESVKDRFNDVFRKPSWQEGILSREISEAPCLQLPGRGYVLFRSGVAELADPGWVLHAPWRDRVAEEQASRRAHSRRASCGPATAPGWVTEVDYDSTIVGGSAELIQALASDPHLEALEIAAGTALTYDSDDVNR